MLSKLNIVKRVKNKYRMRNYAFVSINSGLIFYKIVESKSNYFCWLMQHEKQVYKNFRHKKGPMAQMLKNIK